jgi:predicted MPP superfamily phosphohydrolase
MPQVIDLLLALAAFLGHFSLAVWLYNRLHALAGPLWLLKLLERLVLLTAAAVMVVYLGRSLWTGNIAPPTSGAGLAYAALCWMTAALVVPLWLIPKLRERTPPALVSNDTEVLDIAQKLGRRPVHGVEARFFASLPGNQIFQLHVQRKELRLPKLPSELDGLRIAHLSDLHMLGDVTEDFYAQVVQATNSLEPDLVCITGDILEKHHCLPWIGNTLGKLQARHGKFFILGNHELRLSDVTPLRSALTAAGLTDLGSRVERVSVNGTSVLLAGNELPWFGTAPILNLERGTLNVLLSHTPDQLPWARARGFDLMLAGHNHGGQIRLPWLGALISPSWYGWRYAGGLYHEPPTLLHVSRGIAAKHPIRLNCPPELALLVLTR